MLVRAARGVVGAVLGVLLLGGVAGAVGGYMAYEHFGADLPDVDGLRSYQPPVMSRVYAGDSRLLAELASERRIFVPITAIPDIVRRAFISAEDQNFYSHRGIDPLAITRAAIFDLSHAGQGRRPIGASTITQQVAKNMLLDNQISFSRKAKEAILAMRIEQNLSKDRILELYLNEIYLGLGAYGVAAAAQTYFNKPLDKLTIAEAAFLAALPKAPNNLNPFKYPGRRPIAARLCAGPAGRGSCDHRRPGGRGEGGSRSCRRSSVVRRRSRRRLVHRGSAAPAYHPLRPGYHDPGWPDGAHQPGPGAADRRREIAA